MKKKNINSPEKSLISKYSEYLNKQHGQIELKRSLTKNKSSTRLVNTKPNSLFLATDSLFNRITQKRSMPLMPSNKTRLSNRGDDIGQKAFGKLRSEINFEIKNLNSSKSPSALKRKRGHRKTLTNLQPTKTSQQILKKGKIKAKIPFDKKCLKPQMHRRAKSQQIQMPSTFDADKFLKDQPDSSVICKVSTISTAGVLDNKTKINQDSHTSISNFVMNNSALYGVFDGHGANGHFVSNFVKQILPENIEYYSIRQNIFLKDKKPELVETMLKQAFKKTAMDLRQSQIDVSFSGSTAVVTLLIDDQIYCANSGDSRAILCSFTEQEKWRATALSIDHKGEVPTQAQRIIKSNGRVQPYRDQNGEKVGPCRVWLKTQAIPGLAMTRSFGDFVASTVGVISQPQITHHQITKHDKFMIIASDGLWQFISNQQAMQVVVPCFMRNDSQDAVKQLQRLSIESWIDEDEVIDDITITVVFFSNY